MRSNTAQKIDTITIEALTKSQPMQAEILDISHQHIARISHAAAQLQNASPDFEEFMLKYDIRLTGDFE